MIELACETCIRCVTHGVNIINLKREECDEVIHAYGKNFKVKGN